MSIRYLRAKIDFDTAENEPAKVPSFIPTQAAFHVGIPPQAGRTPLDEEIAAFLRRRNTPCIVAVNKCESTVLGLVCQLHEQLVVFVSRFYFVQFTRMFFSDSRSICFGSWRQL